VAAGKLSPAFEKTDYTCRVKNEDDTLTLNYGRFLDQPTVSAFTGSMTQTTMDAMKALGYGVSTYSIQDCGGTLFSDALLGQKKMISNDSRFASDPCYPYSSSSGEYSVYDCAFTLPMGMVGTDALSALSKEDDWDPFALQNRLYRAISRTGEDILQEIPLSSLAVDENGRYLLSVEGNQRLYAVDTSAMRSPLSISAEGESGARITAKAHPQVYYDGIADLGSYSRERVRITYSPDLSENQPVVMLALLNLDRLQAFTASAADTEASFYGSSVSLTVSGEADGDWLLLPVQAQKGWTCTVDGAAASVEPVLNAFLGTRLTKGPHLVTFTYTTPYFYAGLAVTAAGVLACLLLWMYEYRKKRTPFLLAPGNGAERIFGWLLCLCWWGAVTAAYVLPTAYGLLAWYRQMR
jgi:hypothetical protein